MENVHNFFLLNLFWISVKQKKTVVWTQSQFESILNESVKGVKFFVEHILLSTRQL